MSLQSANKLQVTQSNINNKLQQQLNRLCNEKTISLESKERDTLIEGTIMMLAGTMTLENFPDIHKDDPS